MAPRLAAVRPVRGLGAGLAGCGRAAGRAGAVRGRGDAVRPLAGFRACAPAEGAAPSAATTSSSGNKGERGRMGAQLLLQRSPPDSLRPGRLLPDGRWALGLGPWALGLGPWDSAPSAVP